MKVIIRGSDAADAGGIAAAIVAAFGEDEGPVVAALVVALMNDVSARPLVSLVAVSGREIVGQVLFSKAEVGAGGRVIPAAILAPLAVVPGFQGQGIGGRLIREGLARIAATDADLVFVLGHPDYYPRHGFSPAGAVGFEAPYPILERNAGAWMVRALRSGLIGTVEGRVNCADALDDPDLWRE